MIGTSMSARTAATFTTGSLLSEPFSHAVCDTAAAL